MDIITSMGFDRKLAHYALNLCEGNVDNAIEELLNGKIQVPEVSIF
jgi:hypothetical protein